MVGIPHSFTVPNIASENDSDFIANLGIGPSSSSSSTLTLTLDTLAEVEKVKEEDKNAAPERSTGKGFEEMSREKMRIRILFNEIQEMEKEKNRQIAKIEKQEAVPQKAIPDRHEAFISSLEELSREKMRIRILFKEIQEKEKEKNRQIAKIEKQEAVPQKREKLLGLTTISENDTLHSNAVSPRASFPPSGVKISPMLDHRWYNDASFVRFPLSSSSSLIIQGGDVSDWFIDGSTDAIVCPTYLRMPEGGGGANGAIHRAAGPDLARACQDVLEGRPGVRCPTGEAWITPGFLLPASHVIHCPTYNGDIHPAASLASAYRNSLRVAKDNNIQYIAFPAILFDAYGYPYEEAVAVAISTIREFQNDFKEVHFVHLKIDTYEIWTKNIRRFNSSKVGREEKRSNYIHELLYYPLGIPSIGLENAQYEKRQGQVHL
ncbi:appr-1-p processing enzyme family protein [Trifolium pratense]|uniref:Appr-1-p processing enzyme family protein n=1 Tax=Trifolium pratense TaxID=57577 RepID=A0A2K3NM63_TRIPR|nr:appr-1-p processing enzyme family protein [Trifolium pratense]